MAGRNASGEDNHLVVLRDGPALALDDLEGLQDGRLGPGGREDVRGSTELAVLRVQRASDFLAVLVLLGVAADERTGRPHLVSLEDEDVVAKAAGERGEPFLDRTGILVGRRLGSHLYAFGGAAS